MERRIKTLVSFDRCTAVDLKTKILQSREISVDQQRHAGDVEVFASLLGGKLLDSATSTDPSWGSGS